MSQTDMVLNQLRELAMGWLSENDRRNASQLARTADVSDSSVRRLLNGDALPSPQNCLKILMAVTSIKNVRRLQSRFPGPMAAYLAEKFPMLASEEGENTDAAHFELEGELRDPDKAVILLRLSHRDQVTREQLLKAVPSPRTETVLDDLIKKELVQERDGYLEGKYKTISTLDLDAALRASQRMEDLWFSSNNAQIKGENLFRLTTESVSRKGYLQVQETLRKAAFEIYQIMEAEPGDIPIFFKAVLDTMSQTRLSEGVEQ